MSFRGFNSKPLTEHSPLMATFSSSKLADIIVYISTIAYCTEDKLF